MSNEINQYFSELLAALRVAEEEQKKIYDNAIDIEDMAEATAVTIDARTKIQLLRKSIEDLQRIHNEFSSVFTNEHKPLSKTNKTEVISKTGYNSAIEDLPAESETQKSMEIVETGESKVGAYVRNKLRELSQSGYKLSVGEIAAFQQKDWSKKTLNINYPFARLYDASAPPQLQRHDYNGQNRYWAEVYDFDDYKILFCSEWYENDRAYFDRWLNNLTIPQPEESELIDEPAELELMQMALDESVVPAENDEHIAAYPHEFILLGKTYSVSGWQEILTKLCETMVLRKPYKFAGISIASSLAISEHQVLSLDEQHIMEPRTKLTNGLYVTTVGSPKEIKTRCECILKACGYNNDVFQIC